MTTHFRPDYRPPEGPIHVLYRDSAVLVVAKQPGHLSVPGKAALAWDCLERRLRDWDINARLIHRLDGDTSGVMVFARTHAAQKALGQQFETRQVEKRYVAVVGGRLTGRGTISLPLIADWPNRPRQMVDAARGKRAVTHWEALEVGQTSRVALTPVTGRSHQLRVHMAALGAPILGDRLYVGGPATRLMLHAERLTLTHPETGEALQFACPAGF